MFSKKWIFTVLISVASQEESQTAPVTIEGTGLSASFGKDEVQRIHQENLQKLHQMGEEEILAEQQKLLQMLGIPPFSFICRINNFDKNIHFVF